VLASSATTTGLFVLAGVVVGGVVTGLVTFLLELRRERASARVGTRLLEAELTHAAGWADWQLRKGAWAPWDFDRAHRTWHEYRPELARMLSTEEWSAVAIAFIGIETAELEFKKTASGGALSPDDRLGLENVEVRLRDGLNALRRRQGLPEVPRTGG
jgi:hypothetical protein